MTTQSPAARLAAALETYWPDGCKMFMKPEDEYYYTLPHQSWRVMNSITLHSEPRFNIMTIAAVAAAWWRKEKQACKFGSVEWGACLAAAVQFDKIFEAATEEEQ